MSRALRGFSLVDVIVGTALMLILFLALFGILRASLVLSTLAKAEASGTELANTQMEYLHGLLYDSVGTVSGIPAGIVPQLATTTVDGVTYVTRTYIQYNDDPADGLGASDTNNVTTDYKTGKVVVSYTMYGMTKSVTLVSNFVPPGIESTTGGGTLSIHVVDKNNVGVGDGVVQIINASTTPTVNFTTLSDSSGYVVIGGAATSSQYQIYVSKIGYSSAQTYARAGQNANPTPGYLTITQNQTTSATFAIDYLGTLVFSSFSPATTTTWSDTFTSSAKLASQTNTQVSGGALVLVSPALSGSALSTLIKPSYLDGWGLAQATLSTPAGTTALVHIDDQTGTLLPDAVLPGNGAGFTSFPVSLTGISTTTYPGLTLEADLTSNATTTTSSVLDWSLSYTSGPTPLPNVAFTLTGAKTIGTTSGGASIYKTIINDNTGASASKSESLEWDAYAPTLAPSSIELCPAAPFALLPSATLKESAILGTPLSTTLPVIINDSTSAPFPGAKVVMTNATYAATLTTSNCGLAYFDGIPNGTYTATVSAAGHATQVFPNVVVSGNTAAVTYTLP
jgi:hypothetical protein